MKSLEKVNTLMVAVIHEFQAVEEAFAQKNDTIITIAGERLMKLIETELKNIDHGLLHIMRALGRFLLNLKTQDEEKFKMIKSIV